MSHEEQVGKNFAWGAFSQLITRLFGLVFFVFMSHVLLERGMGQYNFISSFVVFWFIISDFGAGSYLYREWSKGDTPIDKIEYDFNLIFSIKFFIAFLVFIPFLIINWFINNDIFFALVLYYIAIFLSLTINQADTYLYSVNNFKLSAIRQMIEKGVIMFVGGILLLFFKKVEMVFLAMILAQIISIFYYFSGRFPFKLHFIINWLRVKELFIKGLPFVLFTLVVSLYSRIDMVMLKFMQGYDMVGWYGTAYKIYDVANIFPVILFIPAMFPVLSRVFNSESTENLRIFFNKLIRILFSSSLILSLFFIFFAPIIVSRFFPPSFLPSVLAMRILILTLVISSLSILFSNLLIIQNKEKTTLKLVIISCVVNVVLNLILIPKYSLYGAAWATVIAEMFYLFLLQRAAVWEKDFVLIKKIGFLVLFNIIILFLIKYFSLTNNIFVGVSNLFVNITFIWFLGLLNKSDLQMFYLPIKNKFQNMFFNQSEI
ncbi:MAG: Membrane protein involved in the export of O-antigen and teichoic acid [Candidatus Magasanikbacteria bacterium GW2011_GWA2_37_8]|uniref:Membrane protein involved in the export of O-antigen and teichoic acid n=1 Tax=Candidatus Magasanikbacteria bacterium GW2011_GWA2_37_8 TaxID=1619036 RepID=A0A0G0HBV4_9BACT|nr:MAG: Membrane protein involved in the export of O-antigen and teichoic acid [Candidatus Magasanikbacteria bacterium GW2011_GWA2_37_8]